jgi:hypothetical protein
MFSRREGVSNWSSRKTASRRFRVVVATVRRPDSLISLAVDREPSWQISSDSIASELPFALSDGPVHLHRQSEIDSDSTKQLRIGQHAHPVEVDEYGARPSHARVMLLSDQTTGSGVRAAGRTFPVARARTEGGRDRAVAPRPAPAAKRNPRRSMCTLLDAGRSDFGPWSSSTRRSRPVDSGCSRSTTG